MSDIEHWGSAQDRAELDAYITRGDEDPDEGEHYCQAFPLQEPGARRTCEDCGAEWLSVRLQAGMRLGMWQRTYAEQRERS